MVEAWQETASLITLTACGELDMGLLTRWITNIQTLFFQDRFDLCNLKTIRKCPRIKGKICHGCNEWR